MPNSEQKEDDKKMTIVVAYGCLILNLDGHVQAAKILIDNKITLDDFKEVMFKKEEKIDSEMQELLGKLQVEMEKRNDL